MALVGVGVAFFAGALGRAVKADEQFAAAPVLEPVVLDCFCQRLNVGGVAVVAFGKTQFGQVAAVFAPGKDAVKDAGCGGAGVLWVSGQHQYALEALRVQLRNGVGNGGLAVAHGGAYLYSMPVVAEPALQQLGLFFAPDVQGRACIGPDVCVFFG